MQKEKHLLCLGWDGGVPAKLNLCCHVIDPLLRYRTGPSFKLNQWFLHLRLQPCIFFDSLGLDNDFLIGGIVLALGQPAGKKKGFLMKMVLQLIRKVSSTFWSGGLPCYMLCHLLSLCRSTASRGIFSATLSSKVYYCCWIVWRPLQACRFSFFIVAHLRCDLV